MKSQIKKNIQKLLFLPVILVFVPMLLYQCQVNIVDGHLLSFSHKSEIWGHFGDFMNVWVSMASLIILTMLTYYIHQIEQSREQDKERDEETKNRPALIFKVNPDEYSKVKNVGLQVALNVYLTKIENIIGTEVYNGRSQVSVVGFKEMEGGPHKISAITPMEEINLEWSKPANTLFALYEDIFGNELLSIYYQQPRNEGNYK